ncbi:MAG: hypothetical protein ABI811_20150 [Acidobacteriota bacterium]
MSATLATPQPTVQQRRTALIAVSAATIIQVMGQMLIKSGADLLPDSPTLMQTAVGMFTILPLFCGYALYGLFTVIMVFALRHGELSLLYPIMALSYVWVAVVSVVFRHEPISMTQIAGITTIVIGVAVLGRGSKIA